MSQSNTTSALASIIIPCWNQLEFTRHCIAALRAHTRNAWELIVVDNGSTDGTKNYLAGVQDMATVPVTVVTNVRNLGFPAAINQGLKVASGEYLVLLNNDAVVTDGWLDQLIALANAKTDVVEAGHITPVTAPAGPIAPLIPPSAGPIPPLTPPFKGGDESDERGVGCSIVVERRDDAVGVPSPNASRIGLVGPMSNYASPPQLVERVPYANLDEMRGFAESWRETHLGQWCTVPKLSGFCLLMKRAVYQAIGGLDPRFGLGLFDDDDLAERARRAGFELALARDLFVHHFGSRTFIGQGIDTERLLDENGRRFAAKWGLAGLNGTRVALEPFSAPPRIVAGRNEPPRNGIHPESVSDPCASESIRGEPHLVTQSIGDSRSPANIRESPAAHTDSHPDSSVSIGGEPKSPRIRGDHEPAVRVSLTMIVRNEEQNLPHCLESVAGAFDEIVVVDTGSNDRTVEIAESFGARVFHFAWIDDFAAARNEALAHATGDYAFWLDADDVVEARERVKLQALLGGLRHGDAAAYVVRCACDPSPDGTGGDTVVDHIRLFPVRDNVRWTYRVHEQILPALKRAGVPVRWTDLTVRHTGYVDRGLRRKKLERDARILAEELVERPNDPFVLFNLGAIGVEMCEWRRGLDYLQRSLRLSAPTDSITRKLFALIARSHQMLGETTQALSACAAGLEIDPNDAELWFREAVIRRHSGDPAGAERCWRQILGLRRPEQFCSIDEGIYGHLTRRNLAALAAERGDTAECARLWRGVLAECPGDREATEKLGKLGDARRRVGAVG
jgi:glycosyltransferase involved in cell wall biosynthesis